MDKTLTQEEVHSAHKNSSSEKVSSTPKKQKTITPYLGEISLLSGVVAVACTLWFAASYYFFYPAAEANTRKEIDNIAPGVFLALMIVATILGVLSLVISLFTGILNLKKKQDGKDKSIAGIFMSIVAIILVVIIFVCSLTFGVHDFSK